MTTSAFHHAILPSHHSPRSLSDWTPLEPLPRPPPGEFWDLMSVCSQKSAKWNFHSPETALPLFSVISLVVCLWVLFLGGAASAIVSVRVEFFSTQERKKLTPIFTHQIQHEKCWLALQQCENLRNCLGQCELSLQLWVREGNFGWWVFRGAFVENNSNSHSPIHLEPELLDDGASVWEGIDASSSRWDLLAVVGLWVSFKKSALHFEIQ